MTSNNNNAPTSTEAAHQNNNNNLAKSKEALDVETATIKTTTTTNDQQQHQQQHLHKLQNNQNASKARSINKGTQSDGSHWRLAATAAAAYHQHRTRPLSLSQQLTRASVADLSHQQQQHHQNSYYHHPNQQQQQLHTGSSGSPTSGLSLSTSQSEMVLSAASIRPRLANGGLLPASTSHLLLGNNYSNNRHTSIDMMRIHPIPSFVNLNGGLGGGAGGNNPAGGGSYSSCGGCCCCCGSNNASGQQQQQQMMIPLHEQDGPESLSWRRLHMCRAKLKATATTSELLSGFAMVAMVELQINEPTAVPEWLFVMFAVCTTVLVSVHIFALMISTYLLPNVEAISKLQVSRLVNESPHERMRGFIELAWAFSTVLGLFLFLVEVAILCWVKFWDYSFTAATASTVIVIPVLVVFIAFAVHFYHSLVVYKCEASVSDMKELEKIKRDLDNASIGNSRV
ncbi:calcium release-activated calcium channel protein 1-like isoform X1 [Trichogramma pretiosum]|uniref:calcium release-activated calcium channel protein 1-like isoform X1 n=2 Tax=Trichogramma pretiosum TaxID=7493 RepID=UPI0006C9AD5A|nr:calcium release-activated calcium channel protein 1-like isoform X1 [Trichogramma pretiosum]